MRAEDRPFAVAQPAVSAIVVNYDGGEPLLTCLRSLADQHIALEVLLVDNRSKDGSAASATALFPDLRLFEPPQNLGFAGGANLGARNARAPILLFMNPDVELAPGCLAALVAELDQPRTGVVGPVTQSPDSDAREFGATIDPLGYPVALAVPSTALYVPGCALATHADLFRTLSGFDERFFMFVEDVDYCWRALLAGWEVSVVSDASASHIGGASAPGGYIRGDEFATTRFRISLRERNTLAMLLKCQGPAAAVATAAVYPLQSLATAAGALLAGKPLTAAAIARGLAWNVRELPGTIARRRAARVGKRVPDRAIRRRIYPRLRKLELLRRHGFPAVDESPEATPSVR